jgi:FkbM family methyltransferase
MNVFIDLGCYNGDTVEEFRNWSKVAFPTKRKWKIYAFDPNPNFTKEWEAIKDDDTVFSNLAAWTAYGQMTCSIEDSDNPWGTSLMPSKNTYDAGEKITVETFAFSKWLRKFRNEFVVVKMDIEGAEFPVLESMIKDNTDRICDWLLVEFHPNKVVEYTTTDKNNLIAKLKRRGVNIKEWH